MERWIKNLKYRKIFKYPKIPREGSLGTIQQWSHLHTLLTASVFCFGQFVLHYIQFIMSVLVSYCYKAVSPVATEITALCRKTKCSAASILLETCIRMQFLFRESFSLTDFYPTFSTILVFLWSPWLLEKFLFLYLKRDYRAPDTA
jgi:hypothetical protein